MGAASQKSNYMRHLLLCTSVLASVRPGAPLEVVPKPLTCSQAGP